MAAKNKQLTNWKTLNVALKKLSEKQVHSLLRNERQGAARPTFVMRIYGRFAKLREQRERSELQR